MIGEFSELRSERYIFNYRSEFAMASISLSVKFPATP
jgi:hypothetical protein